jgi:hypothetical protein
VLLLQHPVLVLIFKQSLCLSLTRWFESLASFFSSLCFSCSCLVSSSFSEVWHFEFVYCPQVPENSSAAHQQSCFGVGFLLFWFIGSLFFCLAPFLWGKVRDMSASSLMSACYDGLLIVFQFCSVVWLWMLLTGSDEFCGPLPTLLQAVTYQLPAVMPSALPVFVRRSAPCPFPFLQCVYSTPPHPCCVFLFSALFII